MKDTQCCHFFFHSQTHLLGQVYPLSRYKAHTRAPVRRSSSIRYPNPQSNNAVWSKNGQRKQWTHREGQRMLEEKTYLCSFVNIKWGRRAPAGVDYLWWGGVGLWHRHAHSWDKLTSSLTGHISILQYILQRKRAGWKGREKKEEGGGEGDGR